MRGNIAPHLSLRDILYREGERKIIEVVYCGNPLPLSNMNPLKKFLKRLPYFRELLYFYNATVRYRRPFTYLSARCFSSKLRKSAKRLDNTQSVSDFSVHLLSGHHYVDLLLWALYSWYRALPASGQVFVHDDGSFDASDRAIILKLFPSAKIVDYAWAKKQTDVWLKDYPNIRDFRKADDKYIYALKLVDPFFVSSSDRVLVADVDVLWFSRPEEILNLLKTGKNFMMQGKGKMDYRLKDGRELPEEIARANAGVVGYQKTPAYLRALEEFFALNGKDNPSRLIDQAGYAFVLNRSGDLRLLPPEKYPIKGAVGPQTQARHYTGPRRELFWIEGVRLLSKYVS